ncbi:hypothetical protein [Aureispira anguillae]|uniref:Uncharacterized protein n=1 Tax=Aureispira anguillae TaxID=2864201 RepID=A0A915YLH8_9BACT|nr:hypothetical protein [Aureispira anguillae]BDS15419.1 hypothetical protein AsAng_0062030 [Aureispira anguillae]
MNQEEIVKKYNNLVNTGRLPLMFKKLNFEDAKNNHELRAKKTIYSPKFSNRALGVRYTERALLP